MIWNFWLFVTLFIRMPSTLSQFLLAWDVGRAAFIPAIFDRIK